MRIYIVLITLGIESVYPLESVNILRVKVRIYHGYNKLEILASGYSGAQETEWTDVPTYLPPGVAMATSEVSNYTKRADTVYYVE